MATFVLVHGSSGGGWVWRDTVTRLRRAGHEAWAPTLTGMGERVHLASPGIGLDTHVLDVVNVLLYEDLREVVLVGHSYGGMVITGVAERAPERLARLVYLDALVPADGQAARDYFPAAVLAGLDEAARTHGGGWRLPLAAGAGPRVTPHLMRPLAQPLAVRNPAAAALPRTYVACTVHRPDPLLLPIAATAGRVRAAPGWAYRELATGHMPMQSAPQELTDLLLELVGASPQASGGRAARRDPQG
jgi:pimeloyl-ACP methyl ester carboxylesterase